MKKLFALTLLAASMSAHANLIATAEGTITSGCNNCGSIGHDLFGLAANTNLTGYSFTAQFLLTDALLSSTPFVGPDYVMYETNRNLDLLASITLNGHTYDLPATSVYIPFYRIYSDGTVYLHFQNEEGRLPAGYEGPNYGPYLAYDHLSMTENGSLLFNSWEFLFDHVNETVIRDYSTSFRGTIGDIKISNVPEPGIAGLMLLGLGVMFVFQRRANFSKKS